MKYTEPNAPSRWATRWRKTSSVAVEIDVCLSRGARFRPESRAPARIKYANRRTLPSQLLTRPDEFRTVIATLNLNGGTYLSDALAATGSAHRHRAGRQYQLRHRHRLVSMRRTGRAEYADQDR